jgi:hypothetical protein
VDRKGKRKAVDPIIHAEEHVDFGRLSREGMDSGKGMAVHNQLKLYVSTVPLRYSS